MTKQRHSLAMLFVIALLVRLVSSAVAAEERYSGRTIAEWQEVMTTLDPKVEPPVEVIHGLTNLVLNKSLPDHVRRRAAMTLGRVGTPARDAVPIFGRLAGSSSESLETRVWSARALSLLATDAADATPALIAMFNDEQIPEQYRQVPLEALAMIGGAHPDAIPALISTLELAVVGGAQLGTRLTMSVIDSIGLVGPDARLAVPLLIRCLRDLTQPSEVRRRAVSAIGAMKTFAPEATRPLLESLELDPDEAVRDAAAQSLARQGPSVLPLLLRYLEHPHAAVRWRITKSIGEVRPRASSAQEAVLTLLSDVDEQVRICALETLYEIRAERGRFVRPLIGLLASSDRDVRMRTMKLLLRMGPPTTRDLTQLTTLRRDPRPHVRIAARTAMTKLLSTYPEAKQD